MKLNTSFDKIPLGTLERKVSNIMDLLSEKYLSVTLNDIKTAVMKFELAAIINSTRAD